jgi:para-aminobenzoate synthetase component 1
VESFETVHHLVSTITAKKPKAVTPLTVFKTCFPGGSITGAPKKRAMEIIGELEDFSREFYCGSSFYYSANQNFSSNILIRSFIFKGDLVNCWAGGGITMDSNWESEYQESLDKISKLMKALEA